MEGHGEEGVFKCEDQGARDTVATSQRIPSSSKGGRSVLRPSPRVSIAGGKYVPRRDVIDDARPRTLRRVEVQQVQPSYRQCLSDDNRASHVMLPCSRLFRGILAACHAPGMPPAEAPTATPNHYSRCLQQRLSPPRLLLLLYEVRDLVAQR